LAIDLKSFFSTLDHKILKDQWCKILNEKELPKDHYRVFKACTNFKYVLLDDEETEYMTDPELIHERYGRDVELVIDGGVGDAVPTTVVDLTGGEPEILREGKGVLRE
jgi:hypothetical protein